MAGPLPKYTREGSDYLSYAVVLTFTELSHLTRYRVLRLMRELGIRGCMIHVSFIFPTPFAP